jgi:hypothetical protein
VLLFIEPLAPLIPCSYDSNQQALLDKSKLIINEAFDPELAKIRSLDELKSIIKKEIDSKNLSDIEIPVLADQYVRKRFLHGMDMLKPCENWSNYLFPKLLNLLFEILELRGALLNEALLWSEFIPEDIMHLEGAICSQQRNYNEI